jgi:DNA-binding response OmpR family regulator
MASPSPILASSRINLANAGVLLLDSHPEGMEILTQTFAGFGMHTPQRCASAAQAQAAVQEREFNLMIVDSVLSDSDGYEFIRWLRRSGGKPNAYAPVILLTGHTRECDIFKGRDCGANFVVRKPVPPMVLLQRIVWVSKETREFVEAPGYCGPDRRRRALGPPVGMKGRRHDDLSFEVGRATTPNLGQDDIDALFQPKKAVG